MGVKVYRSDQVGAPLLGGFNGSLIGVLDACLVNGFGQVNGAQLSRVGNVVTASFTVAHNFDSFDWITIAGADQAAYNGEQQVTRIDALTFSFTVVGEPATPATGTILAKRSPAGFAKPFAATNRAVYRATDPTSRRHFYRVLDDGTSSLGARLARIRGYETMTGVDDGALPFPQLTQVGGEGLNVLKSNAVDASGRTWVILSDGKTVFYMVGASQGAFVDDIYSQLNGFGDYATFVPDAFCSWVSGQESEEPSNSNTGILRISGDAQPNVTARSGTIAVARSFSGVPGALWGTSQVGHALGQQQAMGVNAVIPYPNLPDNRFYMAPVLMYDPGGYLRAKLPGAYESLHGRTHGQARVAANLNVVGLEGRRFMFLGGRGYNSGAFGGLFFDLTGPWEAS